MLRGATRLLSARRHRAILYVNLFALLFNVALVAPLSLLIGARGAAIGTAAAEIVLATTEVIVVTHARPEFRPSWRILPQTAGALALAVVPMLFLPISAIAAYVHCFSCLRCRIDYGPCCA